jgi:hypothetical protein
MTQRGLRIAASLMTAGPYASFELSDHARRIETAASIHEWTVVTMLSQRAKSPDERAAVAAVLEKLEAGELDGLVFASSFAAMHSPFTDHIRQPRTWVAYIVEDPEHPIELPHL